MDGDSYRIGQLIYFYAAREIHVNDIKSSKDFGIISYLSFFRTASKRNVFIAKKFSYSGFNTIVLRGICHFVETNINISTKL